MHALDDNLFQDVLIPLHLVRSTPPLASRTDLTIRSRGVVRISSGGVERTRCQRAYMHGALGSAAGKRLDRTFPCFPAR